MIRKLFITLALCSFFGCSESPSDDDSCPDGQTRNPVTGTCVAPSTTPDDVGSSPDTGSVEEDTGSMTNGNPNSTTNSTNPDVGSMPEDMGSTKPDMNPPPENVVRFVAIGDQGTGSADQRKVGQSIGTVCTQLGGCDFGLLLGDNVYQSGVDSVDDSLFVSHFADPYGHLNFPFYASLGNHDLGGDGLGLDLDPNKADYQIGYSQINPQWKMPSEYYTFTTDQILFVALNTTDIFFDRDDDQYADVPTFLQGAGNRWKIAFGHHPYLSNGPHGNAGDYEGTPFVPIVNGQHVKDFMEDVVCGSFDFYICGHDHSRQDIVETCDGTQFIVSGAGAKTTDLEGNNATHFEADTIGFLLMEARDSSMTIRFYDGDGTMEHERVVTR